MIGDLATTHQLVVSIEENTLLGGAGSAINEFLLTENYSIPVLNLGLPDRFLDHGKIADMLAAVGLDASGVVQAIQKKLAACKIQSKVS